MLGKIDASLIKKLNSVEWGEYKLGEIFDTETWVYGKNKQWKTRYEKTKDYRYPVISGVTVNNGINYYTEDIPNENEIFEDSLTISTRGEYSGTVTYHDGKFLLANNILVLKMPGWSKNQKLFIGTIINSLNYGGYSNYPRIETLRNDIVYLPISNSKINFDFMESFISELEEEQIRELNAYLKASGMDNYILSPAEQQAIDEYSSLEFKEFDINKIFTIKNTKNILSREIEENSGTTPYLCASSENNSVSTYIKYKDELKDKGNCIFIGGKTFVVSYQESDFYSNDSHNLALYLNEYEIKKYNQLFLATCVNKSLSHKYSWGDSVSGSKIKKDKIYLPTKNNQIDFEGMDIFISAIHKLVIKDVVEYSNKKLKLTKKAVNKTSYTYNNEESMLVAEDGEKYELEERYE